MDCEGQEMNRLAISEHIATELSDFLFKSSPLEQGAFCIIRQGKGHSGTRLLVGEVILPPADAWDYQAEDNLRPSARWLSAVISRAISAKAGLLFVHSHPNPSHPPGLSYVDNIAFASLARTIAPVLDGPFAATVLHPRGWAGVVWTGNGASPIDQIVSIGRTIRILTPLPAQEANPLDARQTDALGIVHDRLRSLTVAVVGSGGTGSPIAEQLVRVGVKEVILVDHDMLDTESNVRRVFGSTLQQLRTRQFPFKVNVVADHLDHIGLGVPVCRVIGDVRSERVFRYLLDADVVLNATDTHGSRAIVNELPSKYLLPMIDVGVRVGAKADQTLTGLIAEVRILTHVTPCLWCRKTISGDVIRVENLPPNEREKLAQEGYVMGGVGAPVPSVIALTVLGSGLSTCSLIALLSEEAEVAPSGYWFDGFLGDSLETKPKQPVADCWCRQNIGFGDSASPSFITEDSRG